MEQEGWEVTNLEWIKNMDTEQMAKDILSPCSHYECRECRLNDACMDREKATEWLKKEYEEGEG
jgi:hypothetical protein